MGSLKDIQKKTFRLKKPIQKLIILNYIQIIIRSKFAFISILNSVIINISFNYTKHDQYEVKILQFLKSTSLKDSMYFHICFCLNLTALS